MKQKKGYSQFIKSLIIFGDLIALNLSFLIIFFIFRDKLAMDVVSNIRLLFLTLNISYIPSILFIGTILHKRIVYAEKITERVFYNVLLHFVVFFSCQLILNIDNISRLFLLSFYALFFFLLFISRLSFHFALKQYRKKGYNYTNVIIIGGGKNGVALAEEMMSDPGYGFRILGFFDDNPAGMPANLKFLGTTDQVEAFIDSENNHIDKVYCTLPESAEAIIYRLLNYCENNMIRFNIVPEIRRYVKKKLQMELLGDIPILIVRKEPLENPFSRYLKRSFDIVFAALFLVFIFPFILLIVGAAIKMTSKGPVFFRQKRTGREAKEFYCYKFRTMYKNNEANLRQATKDDPRITPVGSFLRRTNLDELPQFYNVLKGDMSVVGPRPHMLKHTQEYAKLIDKYMVRHLVKPGITGWAQVTGYRGETKTVEEMEGRVKRDVWYIENWTFWLDIKIIYRTIMNIIKGDKNAY